MTIRTVHLIYPAGPAISCPETIGRHLVDFLRKRFDVRLHRWDKIGALPADPEAALLGHPHPNPLSVFRRSAGMGGWGRTLMLCPFNGDLDQVAWLDRVIQDCDGYLAITGSHWMRAVKKSPLSHWAPRMRHLDLAVDPAEFPRVKRAFAAKGRRSFLFVGHSGWPKNTAYLSRIALAMPDCRFSWAGSGSEPVPGVRALGQLNFSGAEALRMVSEHDFMITVGSADANPATVLEAMAWGLVPVCTPESGYDREKGVVNLPLNDLEGALLVLRRLQQSADAVLRGMVRANDLRLKKHYDWNRFGGDVLSAIQSKGRPALALDSEKSAGLRRRAAASPFGPARLRWWTGPLKAALKS